MNFQLLAELIQRMVENQSRDASWKPKMVRHSQAAVIGLTCIEGILPVSKDLFSGSVSSDFGSWEIDEMNHPENKDAGGGEEASAEPGD